MTHTEYYDRLATITRNEGAAISAAYGCGTCFDVPADFYDACQTAQQESDAAREALRAEYHATTDPAEIAANRIAFGLEPA